jgi:hypothetical protein
VQRIGEQRVPAPGHLPRLYRRVADVARDRGGGVAQRRPGQHDGQQQPTQDRQRPLVPEHPPDRGSSARSRGRILGGLAVDGGGDAVHERR